MLVGGSEADKSRGIARVVLDVLVGRVSAKRLAVVFSLLDALDALSGACCVLVGFEERSSSRREMIESTVQVWRRSAVVVIVLVALNKRREAGRRHRGVIAIDKKHVVIAGR